MDLHYLFSSEYANAKKLGLASQFITLYKHFRRCDTSLSRDDSIFYAIVNATKHLQGSLVRVYGKYLGVTGDAMRMRGSRQYTLVRFAKGNKDYVYDNEFNVI